ncbi:MAG: hypothetical protein K2K85_02700, partial [Clostridia bacterium]|nr:hypothetical protein [Clostridia bacterium]
MEIKRRKGIILTLICLVLLIYIVLGCLDCCYKMPDIAEADQIRSTSVEDLLIKNYPSRNDGKVFELRQLTKLFKLLTNSNGDTIDDVADLGLRNSDYFRSVNGGQDIIVKINGLTWYVAYLSTTNGASSDVVLTLWLTDSQQLPTAYQKAQWSAFGNNNNGSYPANMYGTSIIRSVTLNNGGAYATSYSGSLDESYVQDKENPFAIYTMEGISGSLTDYIVTPENIAWQERLSAKENNLKVSGEQFEYNHANDAYSLTMSGFNSGRDYQSKTNYDAWKFDRLWLPSMAETGWKQDETYNYIGLWKTSSTMRSNVAANEATMLRTARGVNYSDISRLRADGLDASAGAANTAAAVRPAFHLNLTKAVEDSIGIISTPTQLTSEYDGAEQTIDDADGLENVSWYDSDIFGDTSKMTVAYSNSDGPLSSDKNPKDADTYTVTYTLIDTVNYSWADSSGATDNVRTSTFVIRKKQIEFPKFYNNESSKEYSGGQRINFRVATYDKDALKIEFEGSEIPSNNVISVTDVGDYQLDVSLNDSKNYALNSADTKLDFHVTKFEIEIKLSDITSGSSALTILSMADKNFNLEVAVGKGVHENSDNPITVPIIISASAPDLASEKVSDVINLTSKDTLKQIKITATDLENTIYTLSASTTNPNYTVNIKPTATLAVSDASSGTAVRWQLYADNVPVSGQYKNAE